LPPDNINNGSCAIIRVQTDISIEQQLEKHLSSIPKPQQIEQIQELLLVTSITDELIPEIASKAWNYLETHQLWESKYPSLEAFKEVIDYDSVDDMLKRNNMLMERRQIEARGISANWGLLPHDAIPLELRPPTFSRDLLKFLNQVGKVCPLDQAIAMLKTQVAQRSLASTTYMSCGRNSQAPYILTGDVIRVWEQLRAPTNLEHQTPETIALQPEVLNSDDEGADEEKDA
jgi:hypothetical protein